MTRGSGNYDTSGPGEGTWPVFAEKCMAERDEANARAERAEAGHVDWLRAARAAGIRGGR